VAAAFAAAADIVGRYADADDARAAQLFAPAAVETAIASSVFAAFNRERTPAAAGRASLLAYLKGSGEGGGARYVAALRGVTPAACRAALRAHIAPLFDTSSANVAACVNPNKVKALCDALSTPLRACLPLLSLEEAFPEAAEAGSELCLLLRKPPAEAGAAAEAAAAACACVRCTPRPGGPFSLSQARSGAQSA